MDEGAGDHGDVRVGGDVVVWNWRVLRGTLARGENLPKGGFITVPLDLRDPNGLAALAATQKQNWWDIFAAAAIIVLVGESLVANRSRKHMDSAVPAHLNPRIAA